MASSVSFSPSISAETRSLITSSAGWARRSATTPAKYSRSASEAAMPRSMSATRLMSSTDQRWNCGKSSSGRPRRRAMHPDRELEGQLAHQVGLAVGGEAVDLFVDDGADELGLPAGQRLLAERVGHQVAVATVLGVVHAQDHVAHHHADGDVIAGRGERLGVAQDPRAVVVAVGDPTRLDLDALGQRVGVHGQALVDGGVAALGHQAGVRVPRACRPPRRRRPRTGRTPERRIVPWRVSLPWDVL